MDPKASTSGGLSSFSLRMLAMALMLCDHMWATIIPGQAWLTWIGRLAFPIFAFLIVEGYFHTSNLKKYRRRLLLFALLSELPFNLMCSGSLIWPFQQNVLWTFLLAIACMRLLDRARDKFSFPLNIPVCFLIVGVFYLAGILTMVDYHGYGILMVLVFYFFRGSRWWQRLGQLVCMVYINCFMMAGLVVPVSLFGFTFDFPQQGMAVLALLPIWLYRGRRGPDGKVMRYGFYAFYPVHILILSLIYLAI